MLDMMSRGYTPGKPVSRWEADSDNIDIEYKNLDQPRPQSMITECFSGNKGCVLKLLILVLIFVFGVILGYFGQKNTDLHATPAVKLFRTLQDYDVGISRQLQSRVTHVDNYLDSIKLLISQSAIRLSGMGNLQGLVNYVVSMWSTFHFDTVKIKQYVVQLSYPRYWEVEKNQVIVYNSNNLTVFHSHSNSSNEHTAFLPFNAYAKSGVVKGPLVYGHYGRVEDFKTLQKLNVDVIGSIVLIRYGRIHPGNKVKHAEEAGAFGVIFYCDPVDYTDGNDNVEGTWWLPSWGVQLSHVRYNLVGDPESPDHTAVHEASFDTDMKDVYPSIPAYPIMYSDADKLMALIDKSVPVPRHWDGNLKSKYYAGPKHGLSGYDNVVELTVSNSLEKRNISNVIASFKGKIEPDHFVIVGSHIDSWTQGIIDSGTGFSILMDLARTFSDQIATGWRPRRTIIFAFWDASKFGHIGSYEWVQEYQKQLDKGAVAYINLDSAIRGNYSFNAESSPLLYDVIYKAAMTVKCVDRHQESMTVYDMWKKRFPSDHFPARPSINGLAGDSDQSPFSYNVGVPSMSLSYTYDTNRYPNLPTYPVYSTLDDTLDYLQSFIDSNFTRHIAVNQILADVVLQLADSSVLPFNISNYIHIIHLGQSCLQKYKDEIKQADINLGDLHSEINFFINSTREFQSNFNESSSTEYELHSRNDKLLQLTRAFIVGSGLPKQTQYRNVLVAPHAENLNEETVFPGIVSGVLLGKKGDWNILKQQVAILTMTFKRASSVLNDEIYTKV